MNEGFLVKATTTDKATEAYSNILTDSNILNLQFIK